MSEGTTTTTTDPAALARQWLLEASSGTLCTLSRAPGLEGWPFGSIVPFVLDATGAPIVLIAEIAEHTKNARADARVSLFVSERLEGDPQAGWRLNLAGHLKRLSLDDDALAALQARYVERVPRAVQYALQHDFFFWRLDVERVRDIAGFGRIRWLEGKDILRDPSGGDVGAHKAGAIAHMNRDHGANLLEIAEGFGAFTPSSATMVDVDRTGMLVSAHIQGEPKGPPRLVHCSFGREVDAKGLRPAVIEVLQRARAMNKAVARPDN